MIEYKIDSDTALGIALKDNVDAQKQFYSILKEVVNNKLTSISNLINIMRNEGDSDLRTVLDIINQEKMS